jgi:hypothetical protein
MRARRPFCHVLRPALLLIAATAHASRAMVLTGTGVLDDVVALPGTNAWAVGHYGSLATPRTMVRALERYRLATGLG